MAESKKPKMTSKTRPISAERQQEQLQSQLSEAQQAELNARASAYLMAINTGAVDPQPRSGVSVGWDRDGSRTINPGGSFVSSSGAPSISGFSAHTYTRRVSSSRQTAYLHTNIQAPSTRPFWQLHGVEDITGADEKDAFDPTPTATPGVRTEGGALVVSSVRGTYDGVSGTYTCSRNCMFSGPR